MADASTPLNSIWQHGLITITMSAPFFGTAEAVAGVVVVATWLREKLTVPFSIVAALEPVLNVIVKGLKVILISPLRCIGVPSAFLDIAE